MSETPSALPATGTPTSPRHSMWNAVQPAAWPRITLPASWTALILALWCTAALNQAWWQQLSQLPPAEHLTLLESAGVAVVLTAAHYLWLMLLSALRLRTMGWSITLVLAAAVQYFMLHYGIVMDTSMVRNALQTNTTEGLALLSPGLLVHCALYAGAPLALWWGCITVANTPWRRSAWRSAMAALVALAVLITGGLWLYKPMAPLVRNHTDIRYRLNPLATVVALSSATLKPLFKPQRPFARISAGAALGTSYSPSSTAAPFVQPNPAPERSLNAPAQASHKPPLLVLIVGETTRSDHFGLNGYPRNTTPQMEAQHVISWRHVQSCGTNTLASVPCMFSHLGKRDFERRTFEYDNLLDVLQAAGLGVDWLDNQAGCKEVCRRISHAHADQVAPAAAVQQWCKGGECLDALMLEVLEQRLHAAQQAALARGTPAQGTVLVLHQMGSHGPAYYRRSAPAHKRFMPECTTHVTSDCSHSELVNVYDNSMLETDALVSRTIDWLRTQQSHYETGLMYLADHGESLGENGLYLHGLPYVIAPQAQKHVPWVMWPGTLLARTGAAEHCVRQGTEQPLTHDHFYHTVLGLLDVHSPTYQPALDVLTPCRSGLTTTAAHHDTAS